MGMTSRRSEFVKLAILLVAVGGVLYGYFHQNEAFTFFAGFAAAWFLRDALE